MAELKFVCAKCGSEDARVRYSAELDRLRCTCRLCDYSWSEVPLDAREPEPPALEMQVQLPEMMVCPGHEGDPLCHDCPAHKPHQRNDACSHKRCFGKTCQPVPPQPQPPLQMKEGEWIQIAPQIVAHRPYNPNAGYGAEPFYCFYASNHVSPPNGTWADLLKLRDWITEQEEARHARANPAAL